MTSVDRQSESPLVTAIGWIMVVVSGAALLQVGLLVFAVGPVMMIVPGIILAVALATVGIVCGRGLLKRQNWARISMIFILSCAVLLTVAGYLFFGTDSENTFRFGAGESSALVFEPPSTFSSVIGLFFYGLGIYVLSRPDIKQEFGG